MGYFEEIFDVFRDKRTPAQKRYDAFRFWFSALLIISIIVGSIWSYGEYRYQQGVKAAATKI